MESHRKGDFTEAVVIAELKRRDISVSTPFGDNERYDAVVETPESTLLRVQIKTGWVSDGVVMFHAKSQHTNSHGNVYKQYEGDVDWFLVYCHELDTLYWIREDEFDTAMTLRVEEPEQDHHTINWADDYEFDERWPPEDGRSAGEDEAEDAVSEAVDALRATGSRVLRAVDDDDPRTVTVETNGTVYRARIERGWLTEGRVRFKPGGDDVDCYVVYCEETDTLYAVADRAFETTISLRVDPVERERSDTNWAEAYELPGNWPP